MTTKLQLAKREQILSSLIQARQKILSESVKLTNAQQNQVFLGIWSIKDLIAHLIGWDHTNLEAAKSIREGRVPTFYDHRDHDWQTYNAMLVKKYKKDSFQELLAAANDSQEKLVAFLQTIPAEDFNRDFGVRFRGYKVTIQRLLEADVKDAQLHYKQITDFFKEPE